MLYKPLISLKFQNISQNNFFKKITQERGERKMTFSVKKHNINNHTFDFLS